MSSNPSGICQCGCGEQAPLSPITSAARGYVKGTPRRFVHGHYGRTHQAARTLATATPVATDLAWAAGIIDGEGCIQINRSQLGHRLVLTVGQSGHATPQMLLRLQELFGGRIYAHRNHVKINKDGYERRPHHVFSVVSFQAEQILRAVQPYVVEKVDQVAIAIEYRETAVGVGHFDRAAELRLALKVAQKK